METVAGGRRMGGVATWSERGQDKGGSAARATRVRQCRWQAVATGWRVSGTGPGAFAGELHETVDSERPTDVSLPVVLHNTPTAFAERPMNRSIRSVLPVLLLTLATGPLLAQAAAPATPVPGPGEPTLEEVRAATEKYRDVNVALAEGYVRDPMDMCVTAVMEAHPADAGDMGIHYIRMDLLEITAPPNPRVDGNSTYTDFRQPAILIYEPQADGSLELVAVENLVFEASWRAAGHDGPPSFHGVPYDYMADDPATEVDEAHMFMPHWDRHVWLFRDNPNGVFTPFNPNVTCAHHVPAAHGGGHAGG